MSRFMDTGVAKATLTELFKADLGLIKSTNLAGQMVVKHWDHSPGSNPKQKALGTLVSSANALLVQNPNSNESSIYLWCHQKVTSKRGSLFFSIGTSAAEISAAHQWLISKATGFAEQTGECEFLKSLLNESNAAPVETTSRAIIGLFMEIMKAANACVKTTKLFMIQSDWASVTVEFVFFFMHLTSRSAFNVLGYEGRKKLLNELSFLIIPAIAEGLLRDGPRSGKDAMCHDLYSKLNIAEAQYATCKERDGLFNKLARNVAELGRGQIDTGLVREGVILFAGSASSAEMKLNQLMNDLKESGF